MLCNTYFSVLNIVQRCSGFSRRQMVRMVSFPCLFPSALPVADVYFRSSNHFETICKELRLKFFFFSDSEAQCLLPADNERIELASGEISLVFLIKGLPANGTDGSVSRRVGCDVMRKRLLRGGVVLFCMGFSIGAVKPHSSTVSYLACIRTQLKSSALHRVPAAFL